MKSDGGVVDNGFTYEGETHLTVRKTSLFFAGDGFTVYDSKGELVFRVHSYGPNARDRDELVLMDPSGRCLLTVRQKVIYFGSMLLAFTYQSLHAFPLQCQLEAESPSTVGGVRGRENGRSETNLREEVVNHLTFERDGGGYFEVLLAAVFGVFFYIIRRNTGAPWNWLIIGMLPSALSYFDSLHDRFTKILGQTGDTFPIKCLGWQIRTLLPPLIRGMCTMS
ncbi:hypothetical protein U1Q18_040917 [Sarracenia purpurea var. burkii]